MTTSREVIGREARAALPIGIVAMVAVVLLVGSNFVLGNVVGDGSGDAESLRLIDADRGLFTLSFTLQAIGFLLLGPPLIYLFRATAARSDSVRTRLIGVLYVAPIFLAGFAVLGGLSTLSAAADFVASNIPGTDDAANDAARKAIEDSPLRPAAAGFGIAGQLGFAVAMAYTSLQAMKAGLLTRFWGSLGSALGVVSILFFQFALLWFIYLGLMVVGWVPGGRPPAWAAGRAIPWPRPGEEEPEEPGVGAGPQPAEESGAGYVPELEDEPETSPEPESGSGGGDEPGFDTPDASAPDAPAPAHPRKRKRRA